MLLPRLLLPIFFALAWGHAQTVIRVDQAVSRNADKSLLGALAFSAVLPGSGQYYLGETERMRAFAWADAAFWAVCLGSYRFGDQQLASARDYAVRHAGAAGAPRNADFLDVMGKYRSRGGVLYQKSNPDNDEDYNQAMIRAGRAIDSDYPDAPGYQWDWGSSDNAATTEHMDTYNDMLRNYRMSKIFYQVSIGALVLNRAVAMLDVLRIYRATSSADLAQNLKIYPILEPDRNGALVHLSF